MSNQQRVINGEVAFSNLTEHELYEGRSTGKYSLVLTIGDAEATLLEGDGIAVKTYEGNRQRKFTSKFQPVVVDLDDQPVTGELPRGSKVRVLYKAGDPTDKGTPAYANRVRVVEFAEAEVPDEF
jgi:hypothetical protein